MFEDIVPVMLLYAQSFIGTPYIWGGNGPQFDCSGFVQEVLASVGLDLPGDQTAQKLYDGLIKDGWVERRGPGAILFFGSSTKFINHVAIEHYDDRMIEAGGGDSTTKTIADANVRGAMVRIRPIRNGLVASLWRP